MATRQISYAGGMLPENIRISISGITIGSIVSDVTIDYQEPVNRIWDLSGGRVFLVAGMPTGTFGIGFIGGGSGAAAIQKFSVCSPGTITINAQNGFCGPAKAGKGGTYTLDQVVAGQIRVAASSGNMIINEGVGGVFLLLRN